MASKVFYQNICKRTSYNYSIIRAFQFVDPVLEEKYQRKCNPFYLFEQPPTNRTSFIQKVLAHN